METLTLLFPSVDEIILREAYSSSKEDLDTTISNLEAQDYVIDFSKIESRSKNGSHSCPVVIQDDEISQSAIIIDEPETSGKRPRKREIPSKLQSLSELFPTAARDVLKSCLERAGGDVESAAEHYLNTSCGDVEEDEHEIMVSSRPISLAPSAAPPKMPERGHTFGTASKVPKHHAPPSKRLRKSHQVDVVPAAASKSRIRVPRPFANAEDVWRSVDLTRPAQSFLSQSSPADALNNLKSRLGSDVLSATCFAQMLAREQAHYDGYVVLYHSYSFAAPLYEVQAVIARALFDLPADFAPLPRLLFRPYDSRPSLDLLMADFSTMSGQDHNPAFRAVALSASCSLLGLQSEAPPPDFFRNGYSCSDLSFRSSLEAVLSECGLDTDAVHRVADDVAAVAHRHGLPGEYQRGAGPRHYVSVSSAAAASSSPPGQLLQIFVRRDLIDSLGYRAIPMGTPAGDIVPLSAHLRGEAIGSCPSGSGRSAAAASSAATAGAATAAAAVARCSGQARLFAHPAVLTDPQRCILYNYRAAPGWNGPGDSAGTRAALIADLELALAPLLGCPAALQRALRGVQARD